MQYGYPGTCRIGADIRNRAGISDRLRVSTASGGCSVNRITCKTPQLNFNVPPVSRRQAHLAPHTRLQGGNRVPVRYYALVSLIAAALLAGCSGNYKFDDDHYRPLGDPQALNRGQ
jgi:hypothetical protein